MSPALGYCSKARCLLVASACFELASRDESHPAACGIGALRIIRRFMHDWCDLESAAELFEQYPELQRDPDSPGVLRADGTVAGGCPQWSAEKANSVKINRKTRGWNAAAAAFAYGWGSLALKGWKLVGADQLIGGPWPDNEPAVSCMDCKKFNGCFLSKCPIKCNRFVKTGSGQTLTCFTQTGVKTN